MGRLSPGRLSVKLVVATLAGALLVTVVPAAAVAETTIDTLSTWPGTPTLSFDQFNGPTFGEILTAPPGENQLSSFSLRTDFVTAVGGQGQLIPTYHVEVFAWDAVNRTVSGPALYDSGLEVPPATSSWQTLTFSNAGVPVTPGSQYLLLLSLTVDPNPSGPDGVIVAGRDGDIHTGGQLVFTTSDPAHWSTTPWFTTDLDLAFIATFETVTVSGLDPTITGLAQVGHPLTADAGTLDPSDSTLTYQWRADGMPIAHATHATYVPTAADVGKHLTVTITASHTGYSSDTQTSAPTVAVHPSFPNPILSVDPPRVPQGGSVDLFAAGLTPGSSYTVTMARGTVLGSGTADEYGELELTVRIPFTTPVSTQVLSLRGDKPRLVITTEVGVTRG